MESSQSGQGKPATHSNLSLCVVASSRYFVEYRAALARGFAALGVDAGESETVPEGVDAVVVVGAHLFSRTRLRGHERTVFAGLQTEQLPTREAGAMTFGKERFQVFQRYYKDYDLIFDWHPATARALSARYPNVVQVPYGAFDEITFLAPGEERPAPEWDILFLGDPTGVDGRRRRMLDELEQRFKVFPEYSGLWKRKKGAPILRSRLGVNIHFDHGYTFESPRFYEFLANGLPLLSEEVSDATPFVAGRDFESAHYEDLPDVAATLLADPDRLRALSAQGRAAALAQPIERTAALMLKHIELERTFRRDTDYRRRSARFHQTGNPDLLRLP